MGKVTYHKLVRDRIPEIIEASGKTCSCRILSDGEYLEMSLTFSEVTPETGVLDSYYSYYNNVSTL